MQGSWHVIQVKNSAKLALYLLLFHSFLSTNASVPSSLRLVQIVFRHGDRTPVGPWGATDPNPESVWPQGFGQLTDQGKRQLFQLGGQIKDRYKGFLNNKYKNQEIYVRSTGRDRALMSALSFLAGLYPVDNLRTNWNQEIAWQPAPVHSQTMIDDWIMISKKVCPKTCDSYLDEYYHTSPSIANYINENRALIESVTTSAGLYTEGDDVKNMKKMWHLGSNLQIMQIHNKTLPAWATDDIIDQLVSIKYKKFEAMASGTPKLTKLLGGAMLGHILRNFDDFRHGKLWPGDWRKIKGAKMRDLKLLVFSGHDVNLVLLLSTLRLFNQPFRPYFASNLLLELHEKAGHYHVEVVFQDGIQKERQKLRIPGCGEQCPLDQLIKMSKSVVIGSRQELEAICPKDYPDSSSSSDDDADVGNNYNDDDDDDDD